MTKREAILQMAKYNRRIPTTNQTRLEFLLSNMSLSDLSYCIGSRNCSLCKALFPRVKKSNPYEGGGRRLEGCPCNLYSKKYLQQLFRQAVKTLKEEEVI